MPVLSSPIDRQLSGPTLKQPAPLKLLALGDSLVYGFGDPQGGGWVERLRRHWMDPQLNGPILYNLGVRGDTVAQVSQRLAPEFLVRGELRHRVPDWILLSVGINDSARLGRANGRNMTPFSSFQLELANLLDQAMQLAPVLFVGAPPVNEGCMPFANAFYFNHADQHLYNEAIRLACQERQIPYLDVFELWNQRGTDWCQMHLCADGLHPNSQGYQVLFEDILAWQPLQAVAPVAQTSQADVIADWAAA